MLRRFLFSYKSRSCLHSFDDAVRAEDDAISRFELDIYRLVFAIRTDRQRVGVELEFGDLAGGRPEVVGIGTSSVSEMEGARLRVQFAHREADEGALVEGAVEGSVQPSEDILDRAANFHLALEDAAEHHHRDGGFHRVACHICEGDGELVVLGEVLEEIAAYVVGRNAMTDNIVTRNLRSFRGHQTHLHVVGGLEFLLQFVDQLLLGFFYPLEIEEAGIAERKNLRAALQ